MILEVTHDTRGRSFDLIQNPDELNTLLQPRISLATTQY